MALIFHLRLLVVVAIHIVCYSQELNCALILNTTYTPASPGAYTCSYQESQTALDPLKSTISDIVDQLMIVPECGDGFWYRVVYLNMNDSTHICPSNWTEISDPVRTCERPSSNQPSCPGVFFSTQSLQYNKVCGRAVGYQDGSTDSFHRSTGLPSSSADDYYVDGLSVTHGGVPRTHIWTYAVGAVDSNIYYDTNCPCAIQRGMSPPEFVGNDYFCESGNHGEGLGSRTQFFQDDPVWDGEQCEGECCSNGKSPPWFSVTLSNPTRDDIEVRICGDEDTDNEDTPVQLLEIYIQ